MLLLNYLDYNLTLRDPISPIQVELIAPVEVRRAMNGTAYTYIKTPQRFGLTFTVESLSFAEREDILNFFNITNPHAFVLTDYSGTQWSVKFIDSSLDFQERKEGIWLVTIRLEGSLNG